jgi:hypothetical protein
MSTAEERLATQLVHIETALDRALSEAAGEQMAYILLIAPVNRAGEHIMTSNIASQNVIMKFLSMARIQLRNQWKEAGHYFAGMKKRGLN